MLVQLVQTDYMEGQLEAGINMDDGVNGFSVKLNSPVFYQADPYITLLLNIAIDGESYGRDEEKLLSDLNLLYTDRVLYYQYDNDWQGIFSYTSDYGLYNPLLDEEEVLDLIDEAMTGDLYDRYKERISVSPVEEGYELTLTIQDAEEEISLLIDMLEKNLSEEAWRAFLGQYSKLLARLNFEFEITCHLGADFFPNQVEILAKVKSDGSDDKFKQIVGEIALTLDLAPVSSSNLVIPDSLAAQLPASQHDQVYAMLKNFMDASQDRTMGDGFYYTETEEPMTLSQAEAILGPVSAVEYTDKFWGYDRLFKIPLADFRYNLFLSLLNNTDKEDTVKTFMGDLYQNFDLEDIIPVSNEDRLNTMQDILAGTSDLLDFDQIDGEFFKYNIHFNPSNIIYRNPKTGDHLRFSWATKELKYYSNSPVSLDDHSSNHPAPPMTQSEMEKYLEQEGLTIQEAIANFGDDWQGKINFEDKETEFSWIYKEDRKSIWLDIIVDDNFSIIDYSLTDSHSQ